MTIADKTPGALLRTDGFLLELDVGNPVIYQGTHTIPWEMPLPEVIRQEEQENEPGCLVQRIRRVVVSEVQLQRHHVVLPFEPVLQVDCRGAYSTRNPGTTALVGWRTELS